MTTPTCEFLDGWDETPCGQPAVIIRTLTNDTPYALCAKHAREDADILGLGDEGRALADRVLSQ